MDRYNEGICDTARSTEFGLTVATVKPRWVAITDEMEAE